MSLVSTPAPLHEGELLALAWSALSWAWAERWGLIVLAGSGPVLAMKASRRWAQHSWCDFVRRLGALIAVVLCLYSGYLLADTVMVDDQGTRALRTERCEVREMQGRMLRATCNGLDVRAPWLGGAKPEGAVTSHRLPYSGRRLAFTPAD